MRKMIFTLCLIVPCELTHVFVFERPRQVESIETKIELIALANGFEAKQQVIKAIAEAAKVFQVDPVTLTAIAIIETGFGSNIKTRRNKNGTKDLGLFQINTVNHAACKAFRIDTLEGNAFCAAKLLSQIKISSPSDVAKYHSRTPSKKMNYFSKMTKVLSVAVR